jgi:hypothetical protein
MYIRKKFSCTFYVTHFILYLDIPVTQYGGAGGSSEPEPMEVDTPVEEEGQGTNVNIGQGIVNLSNNQNML